MYKIPLPPEGPGFKIYLNVIFFTPAALRLNTESGDRKRLTLGESTPIDSGLKLTDALEIFMSF